jgi:NADPH:quinone reductase-like Zn-dependent oxidoreductase
MKAIVYHHYGPPDVLRFEEIEKPAPGDDEVLIKVRAASVNPLDWHFVRGTPSFARLFMGLRKPKSPRMGRDVSGLVEAVGRNVVQLKPGDAVFGTCSGAFAEYACAPESTLARNPQDVTFEQAASAPIAGLTALQALRDKARVQPGQSVLINGAAGGVGTFAMQMAKYFGAEVTGVCSTRNVEMILSLGADHAIDYTREDVTRGDRRYDSILECFGNLSFSACRKILTPRGVYIGVGGGGPDNSGMAMLAGIFKSMVLSWFGNQKSIGILARSNPADLNVIGELMQARKVTPVIDRRYQLSEVPEAIRYLEKGHARGKVVISVCPDGAMTLRQAHSHSSARPRLLLWQA